MALSRLVSFLAPFLLLIPAASTTNDRTISQVVKLLEGMLEQSKTDAEDERVLFAKFKCYCDTNKEQKTKFIDDATLNVGQLKNYITGQLAGQSRDSEELQQLKRDMADNKDSQTKANAIRKNENDDFVAKEGDLDGAIQQMKDAIETLAEVGADQTLNTAAGHTQQMAGFKGADLVSLGSTVRKALVAASALADVKQTKNIEAFLQGPGFTGTYSAQSGEVVGILKNMRDTFKANLAEARDIEEKAEAAHEKFIENLKESYEEMEQDSESVEKFMSNVDADLSSLRTQLGDAEVDLDNAEEFMKTMLDELDKRTKQYNHRDKMRNSENAALSEAIAILNSDAAFATFGTTDATKTGATSFVEYRAVRQHAVDEPRHKAQAFLQRAAESQHSPLLGRIAALLQAKNPFAVVLAEIDNIMGLIAKEEKADDEQKSWCDDERTDTDKSIGDKTRELDSLQITINTLDKAMNDPEVGLLKQQADTEESLEENHDNQVFKTKQRKEENQAYQKDIANLVSAEELLQRAEKVLRDYYAKIDEKLGSSLVQRGGPTTTQYISQIDDTTSYAPPGTGMGEVGSYKGQSEQGGSAIDMLAFILKNTKAEEDQAHSDEMDGQHTYEDDMTGLTDSQGTLQGTLASVKKELAQKEKDLKLKQKEHKATSKEKAALEKYLVDIKPGCDFITENIDTRKANRAEETAALKKAQGFLENSPAYLEAESKKHDESLGDCLGVCTAEGEDHAKCKACLAKTSVPGFCAGHAGTPGC